MSLATRCTSCATAFRVVQDQLKVSEGWVRCGRCDAVFNALEGLFDLGRDEPDWEKTLVSMPEASGVAVKTTAPASKPAPPARAAGEDEGGEDESPVSDLGELLSDPIDTHLFGPRKRAESAPKPAGQIGERDRVEFSDARFDSDLFPENASLPETDLLVMPPTDAGALPLETASRPEFVRRAERRARWHSTPARVGLSLASLLAAVVLAGQVGHHFRDAISAESPALRAPLAAWCRIAACAIELPRRIEDVQLENSALTRAPGQEAFVLVVTLRNRSAVALTLPSIDLTLTDSGGRLLARRALAPRDFRVAERLAPGTETVLQTMLTAGVSSVVGYTVEIFYP